MQEVFLVAKRRLVSFRPDGGGSITTWLFRTTERIVKAARRKQRLRRLFGGAGRISTASGADLAGPIPSDELESRQEIAHVYRVLDRLPERQRRVLILFELEGMSTAEIATLTGARVGTVRVWLYRARAAFLQHHEPIAAGERKIGRTDDEAQAVAGARAVVGARWRTGGAPPRTSSARTFRRIRATTEPDDAAAVRWARRAMAPPPRAVGRRVWSMAIAGLILGGGGAVAAGVAWRAVATRGRRRAPADEPAPAAATAAPHRAAATKHRRRRPPDVLPDPEVALDAATRRAAALAAVAEDGARAAAHAPDLAAAAPNRRPRRRADAPDEARLLARAFRHLRSEGDATAALAALDERERQFGAGALGTEAGLARAEALLLLGRADEALPILVGLRDPRAGLTPEVRVARAELLARARRCVEAAADFDALLAPGRAARHAGTGALRAGVVPPASSDARTGAQLDLDQYLQEYPQGRFAPAVRAALEKLRRP